MIDVVATILEEPKYSDSSKTEVIFKARIEFESSTSVFGKKTEPVIIEPIIIVPKFKQDWAMRFLITEKECLLRFNSIPSSTEKCYPTDIFFNH